MDPRSFAPSYSMQFRPVASVPQSQQFVSRPPQFQHVGPGSAAVTSGFALPPPNAQFPLLQQFPPRPGQVEQIPSSLQVTPFPNSQHVGHVLNRPQLPPPRIQPPSFTPIRGAPVAPLSSSYTFSSGGQHQVASAGQLSTSSTSQNVLASTIHLDQQSSINKSDVMVSKNQSKPTEDVETDWKEHTSVNGRKYYYNKRTKQSSWEKPFELMTLIERADATTDWKEYTSPDGRKYYYNKITKQSKWELPDELKMVRQQAERNAVSGSLVASTSHTSAQSSLPIYVDSNVPLADNSMTNVQMAHPSGEEAAASSSDQVPSVSAVDPDVNPESRLASPSVPNDNPEFKLTPTVVSDNNPESRKDGNDASAQDICPDKAFEGHGKYTDANTDSGKDAVVQHESFSHEEKEEAKNIFKELLESSNIGSDCSWDQAMRVIINDRRYGILKTLGERKQVFSEYLVQKRKQENEERKLKQKRARDEFKNMLEESEELTSATTWTKAVKIFEDDERFLAVEREKDRRELFDDYLDELGRKEKETAKEVHKRNMMEYRKFLESCEFIKSNTQWRKVQECLEADERCSRLEKIDRLEIFQDYLRDLEKEEEEAKRIQKEELRRVERRNRDEFRKLMEDHVAEGILTAKTQWREYYEMVKDIPTYLDVASNTSGSTPKDLFEDVCDDLKKQYREDKNWVKDSMKSRLAVFSSTWTLHDFKNVVNEYQPSPPISDTNIQLMFQEFVERAIIKEEKETRKNKRLAEDFRNMLCSMKRLSASSTWENCHELFEGVPEFSNAAEESFFRDIFEKHINQLKEEKEHQQKLIEDKAKKEENDEKERRKAKHRKERDRAREKEHVSNLTDDFGYSIDSRRSSDENSKRQKRLHRSVLDDFDDVDRDRSASSHRHSNDPKRSRRHLSESDEELRHRRHKRDHRSSSRRHAHIEELEDGECGDW